MPKLKAIIMQTNKKGKWIHCKYICQPQLQSLNESGNEHTSSTTLHSTPLAFRGLPNLWLAIPYIRDV